MTWAWIDGGLGALAKKHNPLLDQLSQQGKFRLASLLGPIDCVDIYSASLIGAALSRPKSICIVLPDDNPRRPALLFSYAVICHWWKTKDLVLSAKRPILYCGTKPGIREQLGQVVIAGLGSSLAGVFDQTHLTRGAGSTLHNGSQSASQAHDSRLPPVVTAYGPADPKSLIQRLRPVFVAIDLGDASDSAWLAPLLDAAASFNAPVLAWSSNPLSSALEQFSGNAVIAKWPFTRAFAGNLTFGKAESSDLLFQPYIVTSINPLFVTGNPITARGGALGEASLRLARVDRPEPGTLAHKTMQMHWQLLRALEALAVPHDFYEAEVSKFWGLPSLQNLEGACERLRSALGASGRSAQLLEETGLFLRTARAAFQEAEPPLWSAVMSLIHQEPEKGSARILVLPSRGRKELLMFALLARFNITPADLAPLRTWIVSLDELRNQASDFDLDDLAEAIIPRTLIYRPLLVGLPSALRTPKLWPLFLAEEVEVLLYEYQALSLASRIEAWNTGLSPDFKRFAAAIAHIAPLPEPSAAPGVPRRIVLGDASEIGIAGGKVIRRSAGNTPLWEASDDTEEVSRLFDVEEPDEPVEDIAEPDEMAGEASSSSWVEVAYEVEFTDGWFAAFPADAKLNLINRATSKIEERYITAIHQGDQVLLIPHQKRQSLYSLIISRVHQHPSMALPLALLRRWHSDLTIGAQIWARQTGGISYMHIPSVAELLLRRIREAGSRLTHPLTIQFWLRGLTLCPDDPEDLRRVAEVLSLPFIKQNYQRIGRAASRIRGLHRGLSIKLGSWLSAQSGGLHEAYDHEIIDSELGLTFGDVRASIVIEQVKNIRRVTGIFLRADLGTIRKV